MTQLSRNAGNWSRLGVGKTVLGLCLLCLVAASCGPEPKPASQDARSKSEAKDTHPAVRLTIGGRHADVEVVSTEEERQTGLMFRQWLAPDSGMLFVFEDAAPRSFWMKNTWIPLSIAFIDDSGIILNVLEMAANDTTARYQSAGPARFVLEMNAGWFQKHSIKPGDSVIGIP